MNTVGEKSKAFIKSNCKHYLEEHCKMTKTAIKINNGGFAIHDRKYYHAQADYVEKMDRKEIIIRLPAY